jgi:uncharacterized protein YcfJ
MNKPLLSGVLIGVALVAAGGAVAKFGLPGSAPAYADVLDVTPVRQTVETPHQDCQDVTVEKQRPVKDENRLAGTAIGALVGGVLGHQIGGGSGRQLATVAGAAAGGYAGNRVQKNLQDKDTYTTTENRCRTVQNSKQEVVGYDVHYKLGDRVDVVRMKEMPGARIPVKDGQLVLGEDGAGTS